MLIVHDTIHGWSPAGADDVEVNVSQDMCFMSINPITTSSTSLSPICPPLNTTLPKTCSPQHQLIPLVPLTGVSHVSHIPIAPSSDRRAQRNRNRDPSWIPRPRNAFIIFRCEYSRDHAQGSQESQNDDDLDAASVKTLSKRAAEAWKNLPPSERDRYKLLADKEREEHARLYPHYRFRPMKRQVSGTRKASCERSQSPKTPLAERPIVPSNHLPSVLTSAPEKPHSNPPVEWTEVSAPMLQLPVAPLPEPSPCPIDRAQGDLEAPLSADFSMSLPLYPSPEATLPLDSSPSLCAPAVSISPDTFHCNDSTFGLDLTPENLERAQALEAYAIGLYNHNLFSPFAFPEYF